MSGPRVRVTKSGGMQSKCHLCGRSGSVEVVRTHYLSKHPKSRFAQNLKATSR